MLFDNTCGWKTKPSSFTNYNVIKYQPSVRSKRYVIEQIQYINGKLELMNKHYNVIYNHLKEKVYGDDLVIWRYILLCLNTCVSYVSEIVIEVGIIFVKTTSASIIDIIKQLVDVMSAIFDLVKSFFEGGNLYEGFKNVLKETWNKVNFSDLAGRLLKLFQNVSFLWALNSLTKKPFFERNAYNISEELEKQKLKEAPSMLKVITKTGADYFKYATYINTALKDVGSASFAISSTLIGIVSQKGVQLLKYTFTTLRDKFNIKKGDSFIWDKFESYIDRANNYLDDRFIENVKKIEETSYKVKSRFALAQIILDVPNLVIMISQILVFWMSYFSMDTWTYISSIYDVLSSVTNQEIIYGLTPIMIVFLLTAFLKIIGSCWNLIHFKACEYVKCGSIEDTKYIDLETKLCMDECWEAGVDGISSIFIPANIIEIIRQKIVVFPVGIQNMITTLIQTNNAFIQGNLGDFVSKKAGISKTVREFNEAKDLLSGGQYAQHLQG
jgi:hypothetical protein